MNTVLWLTAGILAAGGGITPEPPQPPLSTNLGGGQIRRRFVVHGKLGYITISDPRLIAFFQKVLDGESLTEIEVTKELLEIAPSYDVPLVNNIQVLTDIIDKLEQLQYNESQQEDRRRIVEAEGLKKIQLANMVASTLEQQEATEAALLEDLAQKADLLKTKALLREIDEGFSTWITTLGAKAIDEANVLSAQQRVKETRVRNLQKRIAQWVTANKA